MYIDLVVLRVVPRSRYRNGGTYLRETISGVQDGNMARRLCIRFLVSCKVFGSMESAA